MSLNIIKFIIITIVYFLIFSFGLVRYKKSVNNQSHIILIGSTNDENCLLKFQVTATGTNCIYVSSKFINLPIVQKAINQGDIK